MSSTERSRKCRELIYDDKNKHDIHKKVQKEKKKEYRKLLKEKMTPKQVEEKRIKERLAKRNQRQKKKDATLHGTASSPGYKSSQSLGKAVNKADKSLPDSPTKKVSVLGKIISRLSPRKKTLLMQETIPQKRKRASFQRESKKKRSDALSDADIKIIQDFYQESAISRTCPGKKEIVPVKMPDGSKVHKQKQILIMNVKEAYQVFKEEHKNVKVGKSKFSSLRPRHVVLTQEKHHDVCMCQYCENLDMILEGAHKCIPNFPHLSADKAVNLTVCQLDDDHIECINRTCDNCSVHVFLDSVIEASDNVLSKPIRYYQWGSNDAGYTVKIMTEMTINQAKEELALQLNTYARHAYNHRKQHKELKYLKKNLNEGELIMQIDFAENYSLKHQREVMSAHWSCETVTIYTSVVYWKCNGELNNKSYAVISDTTNHTKDEVAAFNAAILKHIKKTGLKVSRVHYWSDGAGSQFKNRFNFVNLAFHELDNGMAADWSFFETAHGKGPVDGVGGQLKRLVWIGVLQGKVVVTNAKEFSEAAIALNTKTTVLFVEKTEIENIVASHIKRYASSMAIPQTHGLHYIKPIPGTNKVQYSENSHFSKLQAMKQVKIYCTDKQQSDTESDCEDLDEENISRQDLEEEGQWVAVLFDSYWWPGQIIKHIKEEKKIQVKFLFRPLSENKFQTLQAPQFEIIPEKSYLTTLPCDPGPLDSNARFFGYNKETAKKVSLIKKRVITDQ